MTTAQRARLCHLAFVIIGGDSQLRPGQTHPGNTTPPDPPEQALMGDIRRARHRPRRPDVLTP
jgi:hypothetical protein